MKQTTLSEWTKKTLSSETTQKIEPSKQKLRITLDTDSINQNFEDLIAETDGDTIVLFVKQKQIPIYIAKVTKEQFLALINLEDDLSPMKIREILPQLDDPMVLSLCQFMLCKRFKKMQDNKLDSFSI